MKLSPTVLGALSLVAAEFLFAGVGALVKLLSTDLSHAQLVFFRNLFALSILLPWAFRAGLSGLKTQHPGLHLFRSVMGLIAMYCFFFVLANMPLAPAMMALHTAPFLVPFVARVWLKERISRYTIVAIMIGFYGVILVLAPGQQDVNLFIWVALFCAALVAINKCSIRKLSSTEPSARIVFYFTGIGTLVSFFPMLYNWQPIAIQNWLWLFLMGSSAAVGQLLMTKAFQLSSPVKIGLLTYTSVVFAACLGFWIWGDPITSGLVIGTALIVFAANLTVRQKWGL